MGTVRLLSLIIIADFQEKRLKENLSKLSVKRDKRANIEDYFCQRLNVGIDICMSVTLEAGSRLAGKKSQQMIIEIDSIQSINHTSRNFQN